MKNNISKSNTRLSTEIVGNGMQKTKSACYEDPSCNQPSNGFSSFKKPTQIMEEEKQKPPIVEKEKKQTTTVEIKNLVSEREKEIDKNIIEGICKIISKNYEEFTQYLKKPYSTNQSLLTSFALCSAATNNLRSIIDDYTESLSDENIGRVESYILSNNTEAPLDVITQITLKEITEELIEVSENVKDLWSKISDMLLTYQNEGDRSIVRTLLEHLPAYQQ
jgi:uncharacterized protein YutE (UPF0331/DUF86 family)